jgi:hypothetical protein
MALDSLALHTDELEVGVRGGMGGWLSFAAMLLSSYSFCQGLGQLAPTYPRSLPVCSLAGASNFIILSSFQTS